MNKEVCKKCVNEAARLFTLRFPWDPLDDENWEVDSEVPCPMYNGVNISVTPEPPVRCPHTLEHGMADALESEKLNAIKTGVQKV